MNDRLPPIPTPRAQLWRQIRLQYIPVVVFAIGVLAAAVIWTQWVAPPTLIGEAEAIRAELRSPQPGRIEGLTVELLQSVKAGDTIGHVVVNEPRVLEASLAMLRAEIDLIRATRDPIIGQQRAAADVEQLQLEWMRQRVELAQLKGQLHQAETTLARSGALRQSRMISEDEYELAKNTRDTLVAQVNAQTELIAKMEPRLRSLAELTESGGAPTQDGLGAAIRQKEEELRLFEAQLCPLPLLAPIDGIVSAVWRRSGETVGTAEPILQITLAQPERIVGYLRQPVTVEPKPGMTVEVRTRTFQRRSAEATVSQVGNHFEPLSPSLLAAMRLPVTTVPTELGLRIHVTAPKELALRPGEQVDLIVHP